MVYTRFWVAALLLADLTMFILAAYVAGSLVDRRWDITTAETRFLHSSAIFVAVWVGMFYLLGLYRRSLALSYKDEFYFTVIALVFGVMPQLVAFTLLPWLSTSRLVVVLSMLIAVGLVGVSRAFIHLIRSDTDNQRPGRVLIVGESVRVNELRDRLRQPGRMNPETLTIDMHLVNAGKTESGTFNAAFLLDTASKFKCDHIILTDLAERPLLHELLRGAHVHGITVAVALPKLGLSTYGATVDRKGHQDLLIAVRPRICTASAIIVKRVFDLSVASIAALIFSPLMLLVCLGVLIDSGSPVLFRQDRVGRDGKLFRILKFRTMRPDSDSEWAKPGDTRITRLGAVLRRTSLDELPQLFNVVKGEMSLVGPRPEMREFEEKFAASIPAYAERRQALPGITGWAQVNLKRNLTPADVEQVLSYDLFYVEHWSFFLDLTVLLKTAAEFPFHRAV